MTLDAATLDTVQALVALALLAAALLAAPAALTTAFHAWRHPERLVAPPAPAVSSPWWPWTVLAATTLAAVLRLAVSPHLLATIFIGYKQTEQAAALFPVGHYGVGASALYHALFAVFPVDHATVMAANALLGTLTVPLAATVTARLMATPCAGALAALLLAATPLVVRHDASEANHVPALFFTFASLTLLQHALRAPRRGLALTGAALLATLAAIHRPEMPLLVALLAATCLLSPRPVAAPRLPRARLVLAALTAGALITPHALHVFGAAASLGARDSLPGLDAGASSHFLRALTDLNALLRPDLVPAGTTLAALALPLAFPPPAGRRPVLALLLLTLLAVLAYAVDLDEANLARVHLPATVLATLLAATGLSSLVARLAPRLSLGTTAASALALALAAAVLGSAAPTVPRLYAPTNEATEDRLLRAAEAALATAHGAGADAQPFTLVRAASADARGRPMSRFTHFHHPDYLFRPPAMDGVLRPMRDFLDGPSLGEPTYFLHGMRCHADFRHGRDAAPEGADLHPSCARLHAEFELEPVVEWTVPNHGDVWIDYYGTAERFTVGLYRIVAPRPATGTP